MTPPATRWLQVSLNFPYPHNSMVKSTFGVTKSHLA